MFSRQCRSVTAFIRNRPVPVSFILKVVIYYNIYIGVIINPGARQIS
jgi:hypothetical protein